MAEVTLGSLYDAHKNLMRTMAPDNENKLKTSFHQLCVWLASFIDSTYFMLMCKERSDFTLIHLNNLNNYKSAANEVREILESRGELMGINPGQDENTYECWVRIEENGSPEVYLFMLFAADWMVVEV